VNSWGGDEVLVDPRPDGNNVDVTDETRPASLTALNVVDGYLIE
jgi:hypothetical protein